MVWLSKKGITVLNSPGTIDADYRGEICIILVNLSSETFVIEDGERIAQMVIAKHEQAVWQEVEVLDETERGAGGFGHTGKKIEKDTIILVVKYFAAYFLHGCASGGSVAGGAVMVSGYALGANAVTKKVKEQKKSRKSSEGRSFGFSINRGATA